MVLTHSQVSILSPGLRSTLGLKGWCGRQGRSKNVAFLPGGWAKRMCGVQPKGCSCCRQFQAGAWYSLQSHARCSKPTPRGPFGLKMGRPLKKDQLLVPSQVDGFFGWGLRFGPNPKVSPARAPGQQWLPRGTSTARSKTRTMSSPSTASLPRDMRNPATCCGPAKGLMAS